MQADDGGKSVHPIHAPVYAYKLMHLFKAWQPRRQLEEYGLASRRRSGERDVRSGDYVPLSEFPADH